MKNTPFKMKGFSGFGNTPLKQHIPTGDARDMMRSNYGGGPRPTANKRRGSGWWRRTGIKTLKFIDKILPGGNESIWKGNKKIACGSGGCK